MQPCFAVGAPARWRSRWSSAAGARAAATAHGHRQVRSPASRRRSSAAAARHRRDRRLEHRSTGSTPWSCASRATRRRWPRRLNRSSPVEYAEVNETPARDRDPERPALRRALRAQQHGPDGRHRRRRHRRARGLGRGRARRLPGHGRRQGRHRRHRHPRQTHEDLAGKIVDCAQSRGLADPRRLDPGRRVHRRQRPRHARRGHDRRRTPTTARASTGVAFNSPLAICKALSGPLGPGSTADVANCITWAARPGRQGHLDEPGRRRLDDAAQRGQLRLGRRRRRRPVIVAAAGNDGDATLNYPAGLRRGRLGRRDRQPATRARRSRTRTRTSRSRRPA